jgi:transcriptional regulator with XRE-family HTH domain
MTGREFHDAMKQAGFTQKKFAEAMGVDRGRIVARCAAQQVEQYWIYALAGIVAEQTSVQLSKAK